MTVAAFEITSSAATLAVSTIIMKAWPSRKSPTRTLAWLPQIIRAAARPRRISLSSTTSSWSSVAVCMNSTAAAKFTSLPVARPNSMAEAMVSIGRRRLPPASIR